MTISYRQMPNSQDPEPRRSSDQQAQRPAVRQDSEMTVNPQLLPPSTRREVVGKPFVTPPVGMAGNSQVGSSVEKRDQYSQNMTAPPPVYNSSSFPVQNPASFMQSVSPQNIQTRQPVGAYFGVNPDARTPSTGAPNFSRPLLGQQIAPRPTGIQVADKQEIVNGNIILYRSHNFFLRTAYRPGQRQNPLHKPTGTAVITPRVMPHQETRIATSETRMMPNVSLNVTKQTRTVPVPVWLEVIVVVLGLATTFVLHAYNMFNFPRYELDEGTYISNAWAITQGLISPYPYGYGHPPLAWMQIAAWLQLTGGPFTFGNALNSGRVFMLFYAVGSALLVYLITLR